MSLRIPVFLSSLLISLASLPVLTLAAFLLFGTMTAEAQGSGNLKTIEIRNSSKYAGVVVVNGASYQTPAVITIDTTKPVTVEVPVVSGLGPGVEVRYDGAAAHFSAIPPDTSFDPSVTKFTISDVRDLWSITFSWTRWVQVITVADGPGTIQSTYPATPDHFYREETVLSLLPVPNPGARFHGWSAPYNHFGAGGALIVVDQPTTVVAKFRYPLDPPTPLVVEGTLPRFQYRSSANVLEGSIRVTAAQPVRTRDFQAICPNPWFYLYADPSSYITPIDIRVRLDPFLVDGNRIPNGKHSCLLSIFRDDGDPTTEIPFIVFLGEPPPDPEPTDAVAEGVVDAASYKAISLAPSSIFTIFGKRLTTSTAQAEKLPLPESLANTWVQLTVGGQRRVAPLFYASPNQINFLVPLDLPTGGGSLEVIRDGAGGPPRSIVVETIAPALFTANADGTGVPAGYAVRVKGGIQERVDIASCPENSPCTPLPLFSPNPDEELFLVLFGTGFRNLASQKPEAIVGNQVLQVDFAGAHPDFAGLDQINIRIPRPLLGTGPQTVTLRHGGKQTNGVTVHF